MKRSFKAQIKNAQKKILSDDKEFYNEIKAEYYSEKEVPVKKGLRFKVVATATACLLLIGVCLSVILVNVLKNETYFTGEEVIEDIDITELQNSVPWFQIDNDYTGHFSRTYDSVSGDDLFFKVHINGNIFSEKIIIYIYPNPKYKIRRKLTDKDIKTKEINDKQIQYAENIVEKDGLIDFSYKAQFSKEEADIYLEYNQIWYEDDTHFFEFLEEII